MPETKVSGFKIPQHELEPAKARAAAQGETLTALVRRALRREVSGERSYRAEVYRDGRWWMVRVPELDIVTQARNESEVWQVAREWIATCLDRDPNSITVELVILPGAREKAS